MSKIEIIFTKTCKNPQYLAKTIHHNFSYLEKFPELMHNEASIIKAITEPTAMNYLVYQTGKDQKLIGYMIGDLRYLQDNRYVYYMSYFYISNQYRNQGLGSTLMNLLIDKCRSQGIKFIVLTCDRLDAKIVNFYKKFGFVEDTLLGKTRKRHNVYTLFLE